jgi:hypothetical protein
MNLPVPMHVANLYDACWRFKLLGWMLAQINEQVDDPVGLLLYMFENKRATLRDARKRG